MTLQISPRASSVLLITIDTVRADHLGAYGASGVETPVLDKLAREGLVFDHAYAVSPVTLVAHSSLFTGVYPPEHGVRNNGSTRYREIMVETKA